jgi:hypothetical protein
LNDTSVDACLKASSPRASLALRPCTLMLNLDDSPRTVRALSRPPSLVSVTNMGPYRLSILPAGEPCTQPRHRVGTTSHLPPMPATNESGDRNTALFPSCLPQLSTHWTTAAVGQTMQRRIRIKRFSIAGRAGSGRLLAAGAGCSAPPIPIPSRRAASHTIHRVSHLPVLTSSRPHAHQPRRVRAPRSVFWFPLARP